MMGRRYLKPYFNDPVLINNNSVKIDTRNHVQQVKPCMELADYSAINLETQIATKEPQQRALDSTIQGQQFNAVALHRVDIIMNRYYR